ncbi:MAG: hypothetical protein HOM07_11375, partial [Rhodospirillaceae bacterium]|nr:hypothetical protein [Rhodospirillaceae bacterium]
MGRKFRAFLAPVLLGAVLCGGTVTAGQAADMIIGFVEMKRDARYTKRRSFARYLTQALGRPFVGAEIALKEVRFHAATVGAAFKLQRITARDGDDLLAKVRAANDSGVGLFVVDLPADLLRALSDGSKDRELLL